MPPTDAERIWDLEQALALLVASHGIVDVEETTLAIAEGRGVRVVVDAANEGKFLLEVEPPTAAP